MDASTDTDLGKLLMVTCPNLDVVEVNRQLAMPFLDIANAKIIAMALYTYTTGIDHNVGLVSQFHHISVSPALYKDACQ